MFYASHRQFETQTGPRHILPVSPLWIREALGVIDFDPAWHHEGPVDRPDGNVEIRSLIPKARGTYKRIVIVEPTRVLPKQVVLYDPDDHLVASAQLSDFQHYTALDVSLPHRVELQLSPDEGEIKPLRFVLARTLSTKPWAMRLSAMLCLSRPDSEPSISFN